MVGTPSEPDLVASERGAPLPWITAGLPGIGGTIKATPADFVVEELPLYEPCGSGEHVYFSLRRSGWTTRDLALRIAAVARVGVRAVGYAGLKDKHARVTQTFSLPLSIGDEQEIAARIATELDVEVLSSTRHANKLRVGHLAGNRFELIVADPAGDAIDRAREIERALEACGVPNFFGEQRMGDGRKNVERGRRLLTEPRRKSHAPSWAEKLLFSAYQSELFNSWLVERIRRGWFSKILAGDVCTRTTSRAPFDAEDADVETERLARCEIRYTGPLFGPRMRWARGEPGDLERALLAKADLDETILLNAPLPGARRAGRIHVEDLSIAPDPRGLRLAFRLPKGSYATIVAREFTKSDADGELESDAADGGEDQRED